MYNICHNAVFNRESEPWLSQRPIGTYFGIPSNDFGFGELGLDSQQVVKGHGFDPSYPFSFEAHRSWILGRYLKIKIHDISLPAQFFVTASFNFIKFKFSFLCININLRSNLWSNLVELLFVIYICLHWTFFHINHLFNVYTWLY